MGDRELVERDEIRSDETPARRGRRTSPSGTARPDATRGGDHDVTTVLAKLDVGRADDALGRDADRAADALVRSRVQRRSASIDRLGGSPVDADVERSITSRLGRGEPLSTDIAQRAGAHLGHDLGEVRVHTDAPADRLARRLDARAFTVGRDVFARSDERSAVRSGSSHLLAHELAHVVQQGAATPIRRAPSPMIQRNEASADLLTELATPVVRRGPDIEAQKTVVNALLKQPLPSGATVLCLGGIVLSAIGDDDEALIDQAAQGGLIDLKKNAHQLSGKYPGGYVGQAATEHVKNAGVEAELIQNTLKTMIDARQVEYLREAGLPNEEWIIVIEVHFYLDRDMTMWGFHKDTKGQTLFVNLNFHVDQDVAGPEYLINPPSSPEHDEAIGIDPESGAATGDGTLPQEFVSDLLTTRREFGESNRIGTKTVPAYGYVGFVDEAIHHATPLYGHRSVKSGEFRTYLEHRYPTEFGAAAKAYGDWNGQWVPWFGFESYLEKDSPITGAKVAQWHDWMKMADTSKADEYSRPDFTRTGMTAGEVDEMLETIGELVRGNPAERPPGDRKVAFFGDASIPTVPSSVKKDKRTPETAGTRSPLKRTGRPPLTRQMSQSALDRELPPEIPADSKRRFFRTWVRAVRRPTD